MKSLDHVTLVNSLSEIYELFTQLFPEMKQQVSGWQQWGEFTDKSRGIIITFQSQTRLLLGVRYEEEEEWCVSGLYLVPAYVTEIPEQILSATPAVGVSKPESYEELAELFCGMFPEYRDQVFTLELWRRFSQRYRGVKIKLTDGKTVLFAAEEHGGNWDATWPILVPAPDQDDKSESEIIAISDMVVFIGEGNPIDEQQSFLLIYRRLS